MNFLLLFANDFIITNRFSTCCTKQIFQIEEYGINGRVNTVFAGRGTSLCFRSMTQIKVPNRKMFSIPTKTNCELIFRFVGRNSTVISETSWTIQEKARIEFACNADLILTMETKIDGDFFLKSNSSQTLTKAVEIHCNSTNCRPLVEFT